MKRKSMKTKGRILSIKRGYNPNSSSIGSEIIAFVTSVAAVSTAVGVVTALVAGRKLKKQGEKGKDE